MRPQYIIGLSVVFSIVIFASFEWITNSGWKITYERQPHLRCLPIEFTLLHERSLSPNEIEKGQLVVFNPVQYSVFFIEDIKILKLIAAVPGDLVAMRSGKIFVNNSFIGTYKQKSMFQNYEPFMDGKEIRLSANEYWLSGSSSVSVDSRFIGPVGISHIIGKGYAII